MTKKILLCSFLFLSSCATSSIEKDGSYLIDGHLLVWNEHGRSPSSNTLAGELISQEVVAPKVFEDRTVEMDLHIDKIHGKKPKPKDFRSSKKAKCRLRFFSYHSDKWEKRVYATELDIDNFLKQPNGLDRFRRVRRGSTNYPQKILRKQPWPPHWVSEQRKLPEDDRTLLETTETYISFIRVNEKNPFELNKYTIYMDREYKNVHAVDMEIRVGPKNIPYEKMSIDTKARCEGRSTVFHHSRDPKATTRRPASLQKDYLKKK